MANLNIRVDYKVYIAGVLVPVTQVSVTSTVGSNSSANIAMPAHPMLLGVGKNDKLQVAIFYLDSNSTTGELSWRLMFEGYLAGMSYSANAISREISAFCLSNISVFDSLYLEFLGGKGGGKIGKPDKLAPNQITFRGRYPRRLFTKGLDNKTYITRPFDFIGNIFLATAGRFLDRDISKRSSAKGRTKFVDKLASATKQRRDAEFKRMQRVYGSDGEQRIIDYYKGEVRKLIELTTEGEEDTRDRRGLLGKLGIASGLDDLKGLLQEVDGLFIQKSTEDFLGKRNAETRQVANTGFFSRYFNLTKLEQHIVASPVLEGFSGEDTSKLPSGVFPLLRTSRGRKYIRAVTRQTGSKFGQAGATGTLLRNIFSMMNYETLDIVCPPIYECDDNGLPSGVFNGKSSKNRIAQHITKPLSYYSIPPMFNAIFPCMTRGWSVAYQYDAIPTRLYYNKRSQGNKLNTKSSKKGYADSGSFVGYPAKITRHAQDASNSSSSSLEVLVFPEEYYRGPKPLFTEINPLLYQIKTLENSRRINAAIPRSKEDVQILSDNSIPGDQVNMIEEAILKANSKGDSSYALYVKQAQIDYINSRTANANITANLVFNPNMVVGFSSVLFDSHDSNCHMVGHVASVTHTLSQGSAVTTVMLSNTRRLQDMLVGIANQGTQSIMHPLEPLTEVREVLQNSEVANYYFGELFYQDSIEFQQLKDNTEALKKVAKARVEVLKVRQDIQELEDSEEFDPYKEEELKEKLKKLEADLQENQAGVSRANHILNWPKYVSLKDVEDKDNIEALSKLIGSDRPPLSNTQKIDVYNRLIRGFLIRSPELAKVFENLSLAMELVRRPICSLEEYIDFYKAAPDFINPDSRVSGGRGRGTRAGVQYLDYETKAARHYKIIREFVSGPGVEPGAKVDLTRPGDEENSPQTNLELRYRTGDNEFNIIERVFAVLESGQTATVQDLPDLAGNTQELLLLYSDIIKAGGNL